MLRKKTIFMFSGQGSQYYQMGRELYEISPRFKYYMDRCNEIVEPVLGDSLIGILYNKNKKSDTFDDLSITNPALLGIEYALANLLKDRGVIPDCLMGYSLGEIAALVVSDAIALEDAMRLVIEMASLVADNTPQAFMMAIMDSKDSFLDLIGSGNYWITGTNFNGNYVVSGLLQDLPALLDLLNRKNVICQVLPVKYGFHTPLMDSVEYAVKQLIKSIHLSPMRIPVVSSMKTDYLQNADVELVWDIIRYPVNFEETVKKIILKEDCLLIDVGPSGTLATFVKYILPPSSKSVALQTLNPFGRDGYSMEKLKNSLRDA